MWKKTFIRSALLTLVVVAGMLVFATTHPYKTPVTEGCIKSHKSSCCEKKCEGDFVIWESISRAVLANIQF